ncbi:hypothetical protein BDY21DRAFT_411617 [Lineolata rhizophorae]|uniref:Uncharacterized protein n=1 Tax=Lineolata rhizophorae TaxID=578093 RepID=A0A6A6P388_9PEZI|nr:hypothetical protein BDY21DRAFT_411617 [Lineolata rhizophorae]
MPYAPQTQFGDSAEFIERHRTAMVYSWEGKQADCYRLYIEEDKSLDEVMQFFEARGFTPSKRAFQTQFKRWQFPSKQNPAHKNDALVARVRELWERNVSQADMLATLNAEGFTIKERELSRVRNKNGFLLRNPNGMRAATRQASSPIDQEQLVLLVFSPTPAQFIVAFVGNRLGANTGGAVSIPGASPTVEIHALPEPPIEVAREHLKRKAQREQENLERYATKSRRRHTRKYAGFEPDPPGPPRFPSEMTIDEAKAHLSLDNASYSAIREEFQTICEEMGIIKKTLAGENWAAAKDKLIREHQHLTQVFWNNNDFNTADSNDLELMAQSKKNRETALEIICTDVTKRMRTVKSRITIPDAKNALGLNPEQSRHVREDFYTSLRAANFFSKLEAEAATWENLKNSWIQRWPILQQAVAPILNDDPQAVAAHALRVKAVELLASDVMKRLRDDRAKEDPSRKRIDVKSGPGPGPAPPRATKPARTSTTDGVSAATSLQLSSASPPEHAAASGDGIPGDQDAELQIDPSLLDAINDPSFTSMVTAPPDNFSMYPPHATAAPDEDGDPHADMCHAHHASVAATEATAMPVYFRLHPDSDLGDGSAHQHAPLWLGALATGTMAELRDAVAARWGPPPTSVAAAHLPSQVDVPDVWGVMVREAEQGQSAGDATEIQYRIDHDGELRQYLMQVGAGSGGKAVFVVRVVVWGGGE